MPPSPLGHSPARPRRLCATLALLAAPLALAAVALPALGGDAAPGAPAAAESPRLASVEQEIRHLERHLVSLRKVRVELAAGRAEPQASDDAGRRIEAADQRSLRDVAHYESARARALAHVAEAVAGGDEAKTKEARTALDAVDSQFLVTIQKADDARDAAVSGQPVPAAKKPAGTADDGQGATGAKGTKAKAPKAKSKGSAGGMDDMGDDDDEDSEE